VGRRAGLFIRQWFTGSGRLDAPHETSSLQRLKRVFGIDIETCPACGGAVRIIACIEDPVVIEKILAHLDAKASEPKAPLRPPCRAPPQRELFD
jgi:hypothetical protein